MNRHIIALGYRGAPHMDMSVICNEEGLAQLPAPQVLYKDGGGNLPIGVRIPLTEVNLVALRMIGVESH